MGKMNRDCYWRAPFGTGCRILVEPVCRQRPCSFYETERAYLDRTARYPGRRGAKECEAGKNG